MANSFFLVVRTRILRVYIYFSRGYEAVAQQMSADPIIIDKKIVGKLVMSGAQEILDNVKEELKTIKNHGGHIEQYDSSLYDLFIEAYKSNYMDVGCRCRLTAEAIRDALNSDENYQNTPEKINYDIDKYFFNRWRFWTDAFDKGFNKGYIDWRK